MGAHSWYFPASLPYCLCLVAVGFSGSTNFRSEMGLRIPSSSWSLGFQGIVAPPPGTSERVSASHQDPQAVGSKLSSFFQKCLWHHSTVSTLIKSLLVFVTLVSEEIVNSRLFMGAEIQEDVNLGLVTKTLRKAEKVKYLQYGNLHSVQRDLGGCFNVSL